VSPQALALLGIAIAALLAGGSNLLLAWRRESIQARGGVHIILGILNEARDEVNRLIGEQQSQSSDGPRWRPEGSLPDSQDWDLYRSAVSPRLPLATLRKVDKAMRRLDALNAAAARAFKRAEQFEVRIWDAAMKDDTATVRRLTEAKSPEILTDPAAATLGAAARDLEEAYDALHKVAPIRAENERRTAVHTLRMWSRWQWRPLVVCVLAVAAVAVIAHVGVTPRSESSEVQDILAAHLEGEALTACEQIKDREDRFSCVVVETPDAPACPLGTAATAPRRLFAGIATAPAAGFADATCDAVTLALKYSADRQHDTDCIAFFESAVSRVPSKREQKKPGFLARLKSKLSESAADPSEDVPPVIAPDTAFVSGC
jgi:hypothetical protein